MITYDLYIRLTGRWHHIGTDTVPAGQRPAWPAKLVDNDRLWRRLTRRAIARK